MTRRHWWWFLGPWPIRPLFTTVIAFVFYTAVVVGVVGNEQILGSRVITGALVPGMIVGLIVWLICTVAVRWQRSRGVHWTSYLVTLVILGCLGPLMRNTGIVHDMTLSETSSIPSSWFRTSIMFTIVTCLLGATFDRLESEAERTQAALTLAGEQQVQILTADEEARRQASLILHDRVQSGLITVCLELRSATKRLDPRDQEVILPLISRLETLRSVDVRRAAHTLSPNLKDVDFQTAVEELTLQYESVFWTDLEIDPTLDRTRAKDDSMVMLAAYRIIDQALLNVAVHAEATHVKISVQNSVNGVLVRVEDDGRGLADKRKRGLGSTIVTTWVRAVGGSWSLAQGDPRGTVLTAVLTGRSTNESI